MELMNSQTRDVESHVHQRYAAAAHSTESGLCCPTPYDRRLSAALPEEVLERDYGCGDPSRHLQPGETVLDLGSGAGKICFMAAQIVGPAGRVIGIDMNDDMLGVARRNAPEAARRIGYGNRDKTFRLYGQEPYRDHFELIAPLVEIPLDEAAPFACTGTRIRDPRETKGQDYHATTEPRSSCFAPEGNC